MKASSYIIAGQHVGQDKKELSRQLRKSMTPEERILWEELRERRLEGLRFRRQQVIQGFIIEFYCHDAGLAIELDGGIHDCRQDYDCERDKILNARGITVLRVRNEELHADLSNVLERIKTACVT